MNSAFSPSHIILAEDNPGDVMLVREALREHNVHCDLQVISDGHEVLKFIDRLDADNKIPCPELMLLDLSLPKYNGREILKHLRASERCSRTPVIVLTSSDWSGDRESVDMNAATHYFRKTCSLDQFMQLGGIVKGAIGGAATALSG